MNKDIGIPLVNKVITAQFPQWTDLPIRKVDHQGWDNRIFRLGEDMVVRLPSGEPYAAQVEKEQRWLPRLAPFLPLPIPVPLAMGIPSSIYPWHWSVYKWLEGDTATLKNIADLRQFAFTLAHFLVLLQRIDLRDGPEPGQHNFFRGGRLSVYDSETRQAIASLGAKIDAEAAYAAWDAALQQTWQGAAVWLHGDVSASNLLVKGGKLCAVIDFGCCAVGDPACDLTIAWTFFSQDSRKAFAATVNADKATWTRARGWALWKSLITFASNMSTQPLEAEKAQRVIEEVIADHKRAI